MAEGLMKLIHGQPKYDGQFIMVGNELKKSVRRPTGSYDTTILCDKCDNKLGKYDQIAIEFCKRIDFAPHPSGLASTLSGVDHKTLKLFIMSYVWRASITSLFEYNTVNLGEIHEAKIAEMLRNDNPGDIDDYSVLISRFTLNEERKEWGMHVLNPATVRFDGIKMVDVYLPNLYKIKMKVDKRPLNVAFRKMCLGSSDDVIVLDMGDYTDSQEFSLMHSAIMKDVKK